MKRGKSPVEENPNSFCRICACSFRIYLGNTQISMKEIFVASKQKEFVGKGTCTGKNVFAYGYLFVRSPDLSNRVVKNVPVKILTAYNNICFIRSAVVKETSSLLTVALALKRFYCRNFVNDLKQFRSSRGLKPFLSIV